MASTGKKYNVEVGVSVDRNSAKANVENALKAIKSKVSDIKLKFDVDNEDFYSLSNEIFVDVLNRYDNQKDFDGFLYS